jgi:hypothetical protein
LFGVQGQVGAWPRVLGSNGVDITLHLMLPVHGRFPWLPFPSCLPFCCTVCCVAMYVCCQRQLQCIRRQHHEALCEDTSQATTALKHHGSCPVVTRVRCLLQGPDRADGRPQPHQLPSPRLPHLTHRPHVTGRPGAAQHYNQYLCTGMSMLGNECM